MCALFSSNKLTRLLLFFCLVQSGRSELAAQSGSVQPHREGSSGLHGVCCSERTLLLLPEKETGIHTERERELVFD